MASGAYALYANPTGSANTASGVNALYANTTGRLNTASGFDVLHATTTSNSWRAKKGRWSGELMVGVTALEQVYVGGRAGILGRCAH
jgi:hypothetical protein